VRQEKSEEAKGLIGAHRNPKREKKANEDVEELGELPFAHANAGGNSLH
jgi:hypothetical protein